MHARSSSIVRGAARALAVGLLLLSGWSAAQPVRVAAASDLALALDELVTAFAASQPEVEVRLQFGSSGTLFNQIRQGLPVDVFFSADSSYPEQLEALGLAAPGTRRPYAVGRLALWLSERLVRQGLEVDVLGMAVLRDPRVRQLALANPVHAPYGRAAVTLLEHYGLLTPLDDAPWEAMLDGLEAHFDASTLRQGKPSFTFVYGETVSQAAQLAASSADAGIIALSLARSPELMRQGRYWTAPLESHLRLEQSYLILAGRDRPEVRAFYAFVGSAEARAILARYGFVLP